jgi:hypothetical protein
MALAGFACPDCEQVGRKEVHLNTTAGGIFCPNGHRFPDTAELIERHPTKLPVPQKVVVQPNQSKMTLTVNSKLSEAVAARYGERLSPTMEAVMTAIMEPTAFIVDGMLAENLSRIFGEQAKASNLNGLVVALKEDRDNLRATVEAIKGNEILKAPLDSNDVTVSLTPYVAEQASIRARVQEISLDQFIVNTLDMALRNEWV